MLLKSTDNSLLDDDHDLELRNLYHTNMVIWLQIYP